MTQGIRAKQISFSSFSGLTHIVVTGPARYWGLLVRGDGLNALVTVYDEDSITPDFANSIDFYTPPGGTDDVSQGLRAELHTPIKVTNGIVVQAGTNATGNVIVLYDTPDDIL